MLKPGQRARSSAGRDPRSLAVIRDMQMESSETREYLSLIQTYFDTHTLDDVFAQDEARIQYEEMPRLKGFGGKGRDVISINDPRCTHTDADVDEVKEEYKRLRKELNMLRTVVRSDDRMSQLLTQLESQHEVGGGNGSGEGGDDEPGADEDAGGDEDTDGDEG
ncbi:hypothetical protein Tco_1527203, partial [Tanacetum coccineum]